jgi:small-conductance mechanosensitive channel
MISETVISRITHHFQDIGTAVEQFATTPENYYQAFLVICAFAVSYAFCAILRKRVNALHEPEKLKTFSTKWFLGRSGRLFYPVFVILLLTAMGQLRSQIIGEALVLEAALRVVSVWILWVTLRAFVLNPVVRTIALWFLVPAALLRLFHLLEPVIDWLNRYGFRVGENNITAYTILKAIFLASIILWLGRFISHAMRDYIMGIRSITRSTKELMIKLFDIVLYAGLFMVMLNLIGIDLTALAVFSGALGVGLGFGLQKIASNFISGLILLTEKSININNLIEMDDGVFGYVRKLGARASIVETFDGKEVMVPNEDFITSRVSNLTHSNSKGRVEIPIGVSYGSDLDLVYQLILDAANEYMDSSKENEYEPQVFLREFGDSSVNYLLTFWLEDVTTGRWRAKSDVMLSIWRKFKEHNIEIPFPQRDLHIRSAVPLSLQEENDSSKEVSSPHNS